MKATLRCKDHYQGDKCRLAEGHPEAGAPWCQGSHHQWKEIRPATELEPRQIEIRPVAG